MMIVINFSSAYIAVLLPLLLTISTITGTVNGQFYNNRPYPTYSLERMPETTFSCRAKVLGGYYADYETQCQMFHVCVKVPGVGVQNFRFLCPNGTAFDQDNQICADWDDVDCETDTLYYSSDNFDLYRIGSGFETKSAAFSRTSIASKNNRPAEDEETFHLQKSETGDLRSHLHRQPSSQQQQQQQQQSQLQQRNRDSNTDILRGSSSSNFFNNRNNGKEDEEYEDIQQQQPKKSNFFENLNQIRKNKRPFTKSSNFQSVSNTASVTKTSPVSVTVPITSTVPQLPVSTTRLVTTTTTVKAPVTSTTTTTLAPSSSIYTERSAPTTKFLSDNQYTVAYNNYRNRQLYSARKKFDTPKFDTPKFETLKYVHPTVPLISTTTLPPVTIASRSQAKNSRFAFATSPPAAAAPQSNSKTEQQPTTQYYFKKTTNKGKQADYEYRTRTQTEVPTLKTDATKTFFKKYSDPTTFKSLQYYNRKLAVDNNQIPITTYRASTYQRQTAAAQTTTTTARPSPTTTAVATTTGATETTTFGTTEFFDDGSYNNNNEEFLKTAHSTNFGSSNKNLLEYSSKFASKNIDGNFGGNGRKTAAAISANVQKTSPAIITTAVPITTSRRNYQELLRTRFEQQERLSSSSSSSSKKPAIVTTTKSPNYNKYEKFAKSVDKITLNANLQNNRNIDASYDYAYYDSGNGTGNDQYDADYFETIEFNKSVPKIKS